MNWIELPSGKFLNLAMVIEVGFDGPHAGSTYSNPYELRAIVTFAEGNSPDWRGNLCYDNADARYIRDALSGIVETGGGNA